VSCRVIGVDIFDVSYAGRPVKITEIAAGAADAAFSSNGTRIVSGAC
jgi:hypothetical protein